MLRFYLRVAICGITGLFLMTVEDAVVANEEPGGPEAESQAQPQDQIPRRSANKVLNL